MENDAEPGILDILSHLFGDPGYKCQVCHNEEAVIIVSCVCSWKMQGCLACALGVKEGDENHPMRIIAKHLGECDKLRRLVRIAEASHEE